MSLSDQARSLAAAGARFRRDTFGVDQDGEPSKMLVAGFVEPISCYWTPIRSQQQLEAANMQAVHSGILRILKSDGPVGFTPRLGQHVTLLAAGEEGEDLHVRFNEFGHSGFNPEWVIGCEALP